MVIHELLREARTKVERRFVSDLAKRCQILTPTPRHWIQAAEILRAIRAEAHYDAAKIRELSFDALIALGARSIGATVITTNRSDFEAIRRHLTFHVVYWK